MYGFTFYSLFVSIFVIESWIFGWLSLGDESCSYETVDEAAVDSVAIHSVELT